MDLQLPFLVEDHSIIVFTKPELPPPSQFLAKSSH